MEDKLEATESGLFKHLWSNAVKGFIVSAAIGAAVGSAVGAVLFGLGILPQSFIPTELFHLTGGSAALSGAIIAGTMCILPAGVIGEVVGIQSTRDARRYLRVHEAGREDRLLPPQQDPLREVDESVAQEKQAVSHRKQYAARQEQQGSGTSLPPM